MSTGQWDDPEYPYQARYRAPAALSPSPRTPSRSLSLPWRAAFRWLTRLVVACGGIVLLMAIVLAIVFGRASTNAWVLSRLDTPGTYIVYWHERPYKEESLPPFLRDFLGDYWFSEPRELTFRGDGYWSAWTYYVDDEAVETFCHRASRFGRIKKFAMDSDYFTCRLLENWRSLGELEELDIGSNQLDDEDLAIIAQMTSLTRLRIARAKITTAGLTQLAALPKLQSLELNEIGVTAAAGPAPRGFHALTSLGIVQSPSFDDRAIAALGTLPALEEIDVSGIPIGDLGLAHLLQSAKIAWLDIGEGNELTVASLERITAQQNLQRLDLSGSWINDGNLDLLKGTSLSTLSLMNTSLTDSAIDVLAEMQGFTWLDLENGKISGRGFERWPANRRLERLALSGNPISDEGVERLAAMNVEALVLSHTSLNDEQLLRFADNDQIQSLDVNETSVTEEGVRAFYESRKKRLQASGKPEQLRLDCEFPEAVEPYIDRWRDAWSNGVGGDWAPVDANELAPQEP